MQAVKSVLKGIFYYSGLKLIWSKFKPNNPGIFPSGPLWLIGIYVALFCIADQRYQNRINVIEIRANMVLSQLGYSETRKQALEKLPDVQNMICPPKPGIWPLWSSVHSILSDDYYWEMREILKEAVVSWKDSLNGAFLINVDLSEVNLLQAYLSGTVLVSADLSKTHLYQARLSRVNLWGALLVRADLRRADLSRANLFEADLSRANLSGARLDGANLYKADLSNANLSRANFSGTNLSFTNLVEANLYGANMIETDLFGTNLVEANLTHAKNLTKEQLLSTKSLYGIKGLDEDLRKQLEKEAPRLFIHPDSLEEPLIRRD